MCRRALRACGLSSLPFIAMAASVADEMLVPAVEAGSSKAPVVASDAVETPEPPRVQTS